MEKKKILMVCEAFGGGVLLMMMPMQKQKCWKNFIRLILI